MAYKMTILGGLEVETNSVEEVLALAKRLAPKTPPTLPVQKTEPGPLLPGDAGVQTPVKAGFDVVAELVRFLQAIKKSGQEGAGGEYLADVLALNHPKALGGRLALMNKKILADGEVPDEIFTVKRDAATNHIRRWVAGPKLDDYLYKIDPL